MKSSCTLSNQNNKHGTLDTEKPPISEINQKHDAQSNESKNDKSPNLFITDQDFVNDLSTNQPAKKTRPQSGYPVTGYGPMIGLNGMPNTSRGFINNNQIQKIVSEEAILKHGQALSPIGSGNILTKMKITGIAELGAEEMNETGFIPDSKLRTMNIDNTR